MSRLAVKSTPTSVKKTDASQASASQDEICPVCKSSRYLNANLRFLVNPECYHKMCESCVDRIFGHGPAPCPLPGCGKTLRKHRFRVQTFEDIKVEREVDIRRRIAAIFNKREDDFEDVRAFNDYLNEVEDITFNLVNRIDVEKTNSRLETYQQAHRGEIEENASLARQQQASYNELQKQEKEAARLRRETARREEEDERLELAENRRDIIRRLATGTSAEDAEKIARQGQQVHLKRRLDRQAAAERQRQLQSAKVAKSGVPSTSLIKGLKARNVVEPEVQLDPFDGLGMEKPLYYSLQPEYLWEGVRETSKDILVQAGGYDVRAFESRALCEAFAGLGVFVADEATARAQSVQDDRIVSTKRAEIAAKDVKLQDPF